VSIARKLQQTTNIVAWYGEPPFVPRKVGTVKGQDNLIRLADYGGRVAVVDNFGNIAYGAQLGVNGVGDIDSSQNYCWTTGDKVSYWNSSLTKQWEKTINDVSSAQAYDIAFDQNGDILATAFDYAGSGDTYVKVFKLSKTDGSVTWAREYGHQIPAGASANYGVSIATGDTGNVFLHANHYDGGFNHDVSFVAFNSSGTTQLGRYKSNGSDFAQSVENGISSYSNGYFSAYTFIRLTNPDRSWNSLAFDESTFGNNPERSAVFLQENVYASIEGQVFGSPATVDENGNFYALINSSHTGNQPGEPTTVAHGVSIMARNAADTSTTWDMSNLTQGSELRFIHVTNDGHLLMMSRETGLMYKIPNDGSWTGGTYTANSNTDEWQNPAAVDVQTHTSFGTYTTSGSITPTTNSTTVSDSTSHTASAQTYGMVVSEL